MRAPLTTRVSPCHKTCYERTAALRRIAHATARREKSGRIPTAAVARAIEFCPWCRAWHLSIK
jgi:hypothetical protein